MTDIERLDFLDENSDACVDILDALADGEVNSVREAIDLIMVRGKG